MPKTEMTETRKKLIGLARLGIASTIIGDEFIIHADGKDIPDDKAIMDAYAEYEAEQEALANAPSMEEKFERLQTKLVEKAVITEAEKESISEPTLETSK